MLTLLLDVYTPLEQMLLIAGLQISELSQVRTGEGIGNLLKTYCDKVREGFKLTIIDQTRSFELI